MAIANEKQTDLTANGDSDWVPINTPGQVVHVDSVDENGVSASWGDASVSLLYSVDGLMRSVVTDGNNNKITGQTEGFTFVIEPSGFVAIAATGISGETIRIKVGKATEK